VTIEQAGVTAPAHAGVPSPRAAIVSILLSVVCVATALASAMVSDRENLRPYSLLLNVYVVCALASFMLALLACRQSRRLDGRIHSLSRLAIILASALCGIIVITMIGAVWAWSHCPNGVC
jgi:hypothetical protein